MQPCLKLKVKENNGNDVGLNQREILAYEVKKYAKGRKRGEEENEKKLMSELKIDIK